MFMDTKEKVINKGLLVIYDVLEALENQYEGSITDNIKDKINDLKFAMLDEIEIIDDDPRDYKDVEWIQKVYYED